MSESNSFLVVGLGNPGLKYEQTKHNAGFIALDYFAHEHGLKIETQKMQGSYCVARISGKKIFLLKPQSFMNRSGESVQAFMKYFQIDHENILVIHDDLDMAPGRVKMVRGGGAGGHNGIRSLIQHLGSKEFARLKIGIGHPRDHAETKEIPVERFVLSRFSPEQRDMLQDNLERISSGIGEYIDSGLLAAMNIVNRKERNEV